MASALCGSSGYFDVREGNDCRTLADGAVGFEEREFTHRQFPEVAQFPGELSIQARRWALRDLRDMSCPQLERAPLPGR